jgi:hypothetical protein
MIKLPKYYTTIIILDEKTKDFDDRSEKTGKKF